MGEVRLDLDLVPGRIGLGEEKGEAVLVLFEIGMLE